MTAMKTEVIEIDIAKLAASLQPLLDRLESRQLHRVVITRMGKPIGELTTPLRRVPSLWGAMRGTVTISKGVDLTKPVFDEHFHADDRILHRRTRPRNAR